MTTQATTQVEATTVAVAEVKPRAKYLVQRDARKRYSFGHVWMQAVLAGVATDKEKMVAHAVALKVGRRYDLAKLKFETLLTKLQDAILSAPAVEGTQVIQLPEGAETAGAEAASTEVAAA